MITEYNLNEVLFAETELGNYCPFAYQEENFQEGMVVEVLLVQCNPLADFSHRPQSTEMLIEVDDEETPEDNTFGLLDGFWDFMEKCIQNQLSLGARMNFQEILLPNWCRVHNVSHSEFEFCLCQIAVEHVKRLATPQKESYQTDTYSGGCRCQFAA